MQVLQNLSLLFQPSFRKVDKSTDQHNLALPTGTRQNQSNTFYKNLAKLVKSTDQHSLAFPNDWNQTKPVLYTPYKNLHPS
jgi:hypothetical protein